MKELKTYVVYYAREPWHLFVALTDATSFEDAAKRLEGEVYFNSREYAALITISKEVFKRLPLPDFIIRRVLEAESYQGRANYDQILLTLVSPPVLKF